MTKLGPLPPVSGAVRVNLKGTVNSSPWANVQHLSYAGSPPSGTELNAVATSIRAAWLANIANIAGSFVALSSVTVTDLSSSSGAVGTNNTIANGLGSAAGALPNNCAMVLSFTVATRFRGGHCRMYVPGQTYSVTSNGNVWLGTWLTTARSAASGYLTALNAISGTSGPYAMICLSYYHLGAYKPIPDKYPVIGTAVHSRVDSMRRRLGKELP